MIALASCAASIAACGDDTEAPAVHTPGDGGDDGGEASADAGGDDCTAVMQNVLLTCGAIVCHDPFSGGIGLSLDLSDRDALPESLLGRRASEDCDGAFYIDVDAPEQSLLLRKLEDDPPCGDRMPAGDRPPLDAAQRACFAQWVRDAALAAR